tara:strand:- start:1795 stop:2346 length:552 start_codon:yes stop_codon:yes gene_type:complete
MSNFVLDALGLFRRKRITKTALDSDFIMLASTNVGNRSRESQGQMRSRLIRATDLGGSGTCPPVMIPPEAIQHIVGKEPNPDWSIITGANCNQYYKLSIDNADFKTLQFGVASGKTILPLDIGTYVAIVEYNDAAPTLINVDGVEWPLGVIPTWSNVTGKVDIITVVSDGVVNRGVATLGYNA